MENTLFQQLKEYAESNHLTWTEISRKLGVTQNTLTNWSRSSKISSRGCRAITELISGKHGNPCSVETCPERNTEDPITIAFWKVWGSLSERDKARVYAKALDCRAGISDAPIPFSRMSF